MRTRNELERLAAAGRPRLAKAESLVAEAEEERILTRIVASDRRPSARRRGPVVLVLVAAAVGGAVLAAVLTRGHAAPTASTHGRHHVALTGARIQLAGYHFRTPAGFAATRDTSCDGAGTGPNPQVNGFTAAASEAGGCVYVFFPPRDLLPTDAVPVAVGPYQGFYYDPADHGILPGSARVTLYVDVPVTDGVGAPIYLALGALGLTEDQLIAVAESGLASRPPSGAVTTTGTETG